MMNKFSEISNMALVLEEKEQGRPAKVHFSKFKRKGQGERKELFAQFNTRQQNTISQNRMG